METYNSIEVAKQLVKDGKISQEIAETIFPELKENEDETIRETLIKIVKYACSKNGVVYQGTEITEEKLLTWLEKQGEQNLANKVVPKYEIGDVIRIKNSNHEFIISRITDGYYHSKGAFIEIRIADDVNGDWEYARHIQPEPKFNVGDWVIHCSQEGIIYQVEKVFLDGTYRIVPVNGKIGKAITAATEDAIRLWTIQDAKNGDVLSFNDGHGNDCIELIKSNTNEKIEFWFCLTNGNREEIFDGVIPYTNLVSRKDATPATKEQCDQLEKAMADAGYRWNPNEKKMEKIEQNPAWSKEDDINLGKAIWYVENPAPMVVKGFMLVEWLKSLKSRVQPQPKSEWSEEDEANLQFAIDDFQFCVDNNQFPVVYNTEKHKEVLASLKSLKERYTWKPSEQDILLLERIVNGKSNPQDFQASLGGLIGQLKKLKG